MRGEADADQANRNPHHKGSYLRLPHALPPGLLRAFEHVVGSALAGLVDGDRLSISRRVYKGQTDDPGKRLTHDR